MTQKLCIRILRPYGILAIYLLCLSHAATAQQAATPQSEPPQDSSKDGTPPATTDGQPAPDSDHRDDQKDTGTAGRRIFGLLPNYTTVEGAQRIQPVSTKQMFHMAAQNSFDPPIFPFVAFTTWFAQAQGEEASWGGGAAAYGKRYATTFTDEAVATFLTTGIMPTLLHQDPRYFELGKGSTRHRAAYAGTRSFVTLSRSGKSQFNYSDVTGNGLAAALSNLYHPAEDRSWSNTLTRWATQMMWDVLSDELKEFWPDIRRRIHH